MFFNNKANKKDKIKKGARIVSPHIKPGNH